MKKPEKRFTTKQIVEKINRHKFVERDISPVIKCPDCGKLVSSAFPIHGCKGGDL